MTQKKRTPFVPLKRTCERCGEEYRGDHKCVLVTQPDTEERIEWGVFSLRITTEGGSLYADVFVEKEEESVYSVRLDRDEKTVTVYDPRDDEGETVYEVED